MSVKGNAEAKIKMRGTLSFPEMIQGKSAYEVAVINGFEGTEEEWLESLKGVGAAENVIDVSLSTLKDTKCYGNMLDISLLKKAGYYTTSIVGYKPTYFENPDYTVHLLPIEQNTIYCFELVRFIGLLDSNMSALWYAEDATSIDTTPYPNAKFLIVSALVGGVVSKNELKRFSKYILKTNNTPNRFFNDYAHNATDYSAFYSDFKTSIKKNFIATINMRAYSTFTNLYFAMSKDGGIANAPFSVRLTTSGLVVTINGVAETVAHGLHIESCNISMVIENTHNTGRIRIMSEGKVFTYEKYFCLTDLLCPTVRIYGNADNYKFSIGCKDYTSPVWMFGDSYFTNDTCRWIHYLYEDGYGENCLIDAFAGERSEWSIQSFKNHIKYGTPKYAVWCLGMNDGDVDGVVNPMWMTAMNEFISVCEDNNIVPILATIPNTPTVTNTYKNAWIKASGHRYVDFAMAVQDEGNATWLDGLLYSDNVHPTDEGAVTLYYKFINDFPEITALRKGGINK